MKQAQAIPMLLHTQSTHMSLSMYKQYRTTHSDYHWDHKFWPLYIETRIRGYMSTIFNAEGTKVSGHYRESGAWPAAHQGWLY